MGVGAHEEHTSDDAVVRATGRSSSEWFALLDTEGATEWAHARIARFLADDLGVPPWWAQGVAVRYEQARGMRLPGQKADGTFSADRSRRLAGDQGDVLDAALAALVPRLGEPYGVNRTSAYLRARWRLDDGSRLIASADPASGGRVALVLTRERLADPLQVEAAKAELGDLLDAVEAVHTTGASGASE
jgi:hypothetical protein